MRSNWYEIILRRLVRLTVISALKVDPTSTSLSSAKTRTGVVPGVGDVEGVPEGNDIVAVAVGVPGPSTTEFFRFGESPHPP